MSTKEVETAKQLLAQVNFAEMPDFIDYAVAEARVGPLADTLFQIEKLRITAERHPDRILSFEQSQAHTATHQQGSHQNTA